MSQLMPIFESIRHKENLPCTYPIKVERPAAFLRVTRAPIGWESLFGVERVP